MTFFLVTFFPWDFFPCDFFSCDFFFLVTFFPVTFFLWLFFLQSFWRVAFFVHPVHNYDFTFNSMGPYTINISWLYKICWHGTARQTVSNAIYFMGLGQLANIFVLLWKGNYIFVNWLYCKVFNYCSFTILNLYELCAS